MRSRHWQIWSPFSGDCFVSFTPSLRNNRYFVLDDMVKEQGTPFMEEDRNYYPVPAFGTEEAPVFERGYQ